MNENISRILASVLLSLLVATGCTVDLGAVSSVEQTAVRAEMTGPPEPSSILPSLTPMQDNQPWSTPASPTPEVNSGTVQSPSEGTIVLGTIEQSEPSSPLPVPNMTRDAQSQPRTTTTPLPTLAFEDGVAMMCQESPQRFDLLEVSDFRVMVDLRFESEDLVTFEGWTSRPEPSVRPLTPEPTPESFPIPDSSYPIMLAGGQLDLSSHELSLRPLNMNAPLASPCGEVCPLEVLGQSPNGEWQLVQVNDWLRAQMGLWLVSEESAIRVVPYVPAVSNWQWAEDSSLLWLVYYYPEAGGETLVFQLDDPPDAHETKVANLLDPFGYWLGYSPLDNTAYAVPAPGMGHEDTELLFTIDQNNNPETADSIWRVPGIASVAWNEATHSMIAQIVTENGIMFQDLSGSTSWTIPNETLASIFSSFTSAADNLPNGFSSSGEWAASPSGNKLALIHGYTVLWIFDCVPAP